MNVIETKQKYYKQQCFDLISDKYTKSKCLKFIDKYKSIKLVLYINQTASIVEKYGKNSEFDGFCFGYNKYWRLHMINKNEQIITDSFKNGVPILNEIYRYQVGKAPVYVRKNYKSKMGHRIVHILVDRFFNKNCIKGTFFDVMLKSYDKYNSHAFSIYFDHNHVHSFDANFGWIKWDRNTPKEELYSFFTEYFEFNNYDYHQVGVYGKYKIIGHIQESVNKLEQHYIKKHEKMIDSYFSD
jgi:hypothetical protein